MKELRNDIFIGAGSRDGDRGWAMAEAIGRLAAAGVFIVRVSSLWETEPVDLPGDRPLLNGAAQIATTLPPRGLLEVCRRIERELGRVRAPSAGRGPDAGHRPIDLDLLLYGRRVVNEPDLILPHPRMDRRRFVLAPLAEIAPGAEHPATGRSAAQMLASCEDDAWVRVVAGPAAWWTPLVEPPPRFR